MSIGTRIGRMGCGLLAVLIVGAIVGFLFVAFAMIASYFFLALKGFYDTDRVYFDIIVGIWVLGILAVLVFIFLGTVQDGWKARQKRKAEQERAEAQKRKSIAELEEQVVKLAHDNAVLRDEMKVHTRAQLGVRSDLTSDQ